MTLERLQFEQFGPYAAPQTIDFSDFAGYQLFLIHGATGSGKSFVLDAICYALYSESSGSERDATELRSHYATKNDPTEVTLDFRLGGKLYRVWRRPRMELAKKRGSGTTTRGPDAELYDRTDAERGATGTLIAEGKRDVTARIESLLGLHVDQFRQVVLLPQGKFRDFLSADSKAREDILKMLFETQQYADLEDELKTMHGEAKEETQALLTERETVLSQHDVDTLEALRQKEKDCTQTLSDKKEAQQQTSEKLKQAKEALQTARDQQQRLDAVEAAKERVEALRSEQEQQTARKRRAKEAEQAQRIASADTLLTDRESSKNDASKALQAAQKEFEQATERLQKAESKLKAEHSRSDKRDAMDDQIRTLKSARSDVEARAEAQDAATSAQKTLKAAQDEQAALNDEIEQIAADIEKAESAIAEHRKEAQSVDQRDRNVSTWKERLERARTLRKTKEQRQKARQSLEEAQARVEEQAETRDANKEQVRALEQARDEGYASVLAAQLTDGEACPVCGSTSHPAPADDAHDVPDADALESARSELDAAESTLQTLQKKESEAQRAVDKHSSKIEALQDTDAALTEHTVSEIEAKHQEAKEALSSAQTAKKNVETASERLDALTETLTEKEEALETKKEEVRAAQSTYEQATARVEDLTERVPDGIETVEALDAKLSDLEEKLSAMNKALEEAKSAKQEADKAHAAAESALATKREALATAQQKYEDAQSSFREDLHEQGFEDRTAYEASRMDTDALEDLRDTIQEVDKKWSTAQSNLKEAKAKAEGISDPDAEGAKAQVDALDERINELSQEIGALESTQASLRTALEQLSELKEKTAKAEAKVERIGHLSQVARGTGANERNISLQRYVLAARLKHVLKVANLHLERMSQGQYHLKRATTLDDARRSGGLDLRVHDAYTNEDRSVNTLSGGEGFNTSLALALGLSDVVQQRSGGRHLNTLFIDEGFGTLDQETLDRALNVLYDVQEQQSSRLLGVISHVTELKRRLPARLTVQSAQDGSRIKVET